MDLQLQGGMNLGPVKHPDKKGIALDDTTFSKCPSQAAVQWPNAQETSRAQESFSKFFNFEESQ